jgi:uncharacterized membrane protein (UPF0127 family)
VTGPAVSSDRPRAARTSAPRTDRRAWRGRALAVALALVLTTAACGDSDDDSSASPAPGSSTTDETAGPAAALSLDDLAAASGDAPAATGAGVTEDPGPTDRRGLPGTGETAASITASDGTVQGCCLLVAADEETRQRGLMEVTDLGGYTGMVFVWDEDSSGGFWMRNTPTALSIAFFTADGDYVSSTDMEPCDDTADCPVYPSPGTYRFAVEVPQGDLDRLGVGPGSRLALGGACAAASADP